MTDHAELFQATVEVSKEFDGPNCVEAAALLVEIGERLGYDLQARPVSLFAVNKETGAVVVTGDYGKAFATTYLERYGSVLPVGELEGGTPFQRHAGHMIVVSREHSLVLDPTFAQFDQLGDQAVALWADETVLHSSGRFWVVGDDALYARYSIADDYMELDFAEVREAQAELADRIVAALGH